MTPFRALFKTTLRENFALKRLLGSSASKSKKTMIFVVLAMLYALVVFLGSFGFLFFSLAETLSGIGLIEMLLMFLFFYSTSISVLFVTLAANGSLFHFKDYDIIAPLPFTPRQIVAVKLSMMMINLYVTSLLFVSPILFSYFYFAPTGFFNVLFLIIGFFFIPMIPVVICSFLSMLIARISALFKKSNLINIIIMLVMFLGIMVLSFSFSFSGDYNPFLGQVSFIESLGDVYLPMMWFANAVHNADFLSLIWFILVCGVPFVGFVYFLSKMIMKTNAIVNVVRTSKNGKKVVFEQSNVFSTLISKEFRKFFNTPIYALNCGFGLVLLAIGAIASLIFKADLVPYLTMAIGLELPIASLILLVAGFCVSMVYTTAISLSLEGKNFWVLRSLPISPKTIMQAKLAFNIILCLPLAIVSIGLLSISLEIEFWTMIVMMLAISSLSFVTSSMGSVINLYLPKFDFLNDTEIVKQNMAALVGIFGGFGIIAADAFLYYGLDIIFSPEISLLLVAVVNSILGCGFYLWMNRSCENLFIKMTA